MGFILRLVVGGMLGALGGDFYRWVKTEVQHTTTWFAFAAGVDKCLCTTKNLLRHIFSIKIS